MEVPEEEPLFRHFSHEHPLKLTNSPFSENITCYGCKLNLLSGKAYYNCKTCRFSLHQMCYNMPRNIQHPVDPNHNLTLLATPSSAKGNTKCRACGHTVNGFYYFCPKCGDHYHILCSAVPLCITIPSHPHGLNLEFLPPYEFECDLCKKPGYSGWLYRCAFCDFDAHLACAFSNPKAQSFLYQSVPLPSHKTTSGFSSAIPCIDCSELMQLIAKGVVASIGESGHDIALTVEGGPDKELGCSKRNIEENIRSSDYQSKSDIAGNTSCPRKQSQPSTPQSEDLSTMSSYQFSDAYFSIDLARTYPADDDTNQASAEAIYSQYETTRDVPEIKETKGGSSYIVLPNKLYESGSDRHFSGPEYRQNGSISIGTDALIWKELGQENKMRNGFRDGSDIKDQSAKSDTASLGYCSCWSRLFVCCYYLRNMRI